MRRMDKALARANDEAAYLAADLAELRLTGVPAGCVVAMRHKMDEVRRLLGEVEELLTDLETLFE